MQIQSIDTPPPGTKKNPPPAWHCVAFNAEIEDTFSFSNPMLSPLAQWIKADMERALSESGILRAEAPDPAKTGKVSGPSVVLAQLNWLSGAFFITADLRKGLSTLESELKRIGLFAHCEIGWNCPDELIWRRSWPKEGPDTFQPILLTPTAPPVTPILQTTVGLFLKAFATGMAPTFAAIIASIPKPPSAGQPSPGDSKP